jgi:hypothetical protein
VAHREAVAFGAVGVEADHSGVFVERLLGLTLSHGAVERGHAFVTGVLQRTPAAPSIPRPDTMWYASSR